MDGDRITLLGLSLPASLELRAVVLAPRATLAHDDADWRGALVVVEQGTIDLVTRGGARRRLPRGAVVWLDGLSLGALHNPGPAPAVLAAVSRRARRPPARDR
jgi:hypothetical protein